MTGELLVERRGPILIITINRPGVRNAINRAVAAGLDAAVQELDEADDLKVGVLTGAGETFCAGMDLKMFAAGTRPTTAGRGLIRMLEKPPEKPLIAAVEGYALAGGFELVLACDVVVASTTAQFGLSEVKRGLIASGGGLLRIGHWLPRGLAMKLALTGEMLPADDAFRLGLVSKIVAPGLACNEAVAVAECISANAPRAVQVSKKMLVQSRNWAPDRAFELQAPFVEEIMNSDDAAEGAKAFVEKRKPTWVGH
jgi:enoyl-CoA hydratase